jgi:hypothetical protein
MSTMSRIEANDECAARIAWRRAFDEQLTELAMARACRYATSRARALVRAGILDERNAPYDRHVAYRSARLGLRPAGADELLQRTWVVREAPEGPITIATSWSTSAPGSRSSSTTTIPAEAKTMSQTQAPFDTRWAIAAGVAVKKLEWLAEEAVIPAIRWRILEGTDGFAAIVGGDGPADDYEDFVAAFAAKVKVPVYLLDFNDEASSILEYARKAKPKRLRGHPAAFLRERGITAPGHEPRKRSPLRKVLVVEGATPEATRKASIDKSLTFEPHARGALVRGDVRISGLDLIEKKVKGPVYGLLYDTEDGRYWCHIDERGKKSRLFQPDGNREDAQFYDYVDDILGERTLDGILRVLGIPKDYLAP